MKKTASLCISSVIACSLLLLYTSCHKPVNHYQHLKMLLGKNAYSYNLIFITNSGAECRNCNAAISALFYDEHIAEQYQQTLFILMPDKNANEQQYYKQEFSFIDPKPHIVFNTTLYNYYNDRLPGSYQTGGLFVTNPDDSIILAASLKGSRLIDDIYRLK